MGAIVIRTRFDEGTESAEVASSASCWLNMINYVYIEYLIIWGIIYT